MTDDLPSVLARVAEKLHGWSVNRRGEIAQEFPVRKTWGELQNEHLLTGNGMVETKRLMREQGWNWAANQNRDGVRWTWWRPMKHEGDTPSMFEASRETEAEALYVAADAALKEST
jgi:hypothetical protein